MAFLLKSEEIRCGTRLPDTHVLDAMGYGGDNRSPHLTWTGAPEGTKSFVVTCYDPDAPTGSGWWHWVVANIPADVTELPAGASGTDGGLPAVALETRTDFGKPGYGGAAPPSGPAHRYVFTVHALKVDKLDIDADASPALVGFMTHMNTLGKAEIVTIFGSN